MDCLLKETAILFVMREKFNEFDCSVRLRE